MRPRHWTNLKQMIDIDFDHEAADFNLDKTMSLGLAQHDNAILDMVDTAGKEQQIEEGRPKAGAKHGADDGPIGDEP